MRKNMSKKRRILAVDDDPINLFLLNEFLENDFEVRLASSGEEALDEIPDFQPEVILLDIMMPELDGFQVCSKIREDRANDNIKVLFLSAKQTLNDRLYGYECGADDFISKPFNHDELLARIKIFLRCSRLV